MPALETRSVEGSFRDLDTVKDGGNTYHEVQMMFPHEKVDTFRTVFLRDTFTDGFNARLPQMCWQHLLNEPIGHATRAQSGSQGNEIVARFSRFDPDFGGAPNPLAYRAYSQIEDGTLTDFSFGFQRTASVTPWRSRDGQRAIAFTKAHMQEVSPVTIGSIPGAGVTDLRGAFGLGPEDPPTRDEVLAWRTAGVIDEVRCAELLRMLVPENFRDHIVVSRAAPVIETPEDEIDEGDPELTADEVRAVADDDPALLAQACDAALDAAQSLLDNTDRSALPENVQQALGLVFAASSSIDEYLDAMGIDDPDEGTEDEGSRAVGMTAQFGGPLPLHICDHCGGRGHLTDDMLRKDAPDECPTCDGSGFLYDDGEPYRMESERAAEVEETRAVLTSKARKKLPKSAFAYVDSDGVGHFPIHDKAHVRNALARLSSSPHGDKARPKVMAAAKRMGIDTDEDDNKKRSAEEPETTATAAEIEAMLNKRLGSA